jgi:tripartite-type tricarboxylate transporter receptor subunit TctC
MPAKDLNEMIAWLKTNPNKESVGIIGRGPQLLSVFFQKETGIRLNMVPYRGGTPAKEDLVAGQIVLLFDVPDALSLVRAGSIKAYSVSDARLEAASDLPTSRGCPLFPGQHGRCFSHPRVCQVTLSPSSTCDCGSTGRSVGALAGR